MMEMRWMSLDISFKSFCLTNQLKDKYKFSAVMFWCPITSFLDAKRQLLYDLQLYYYTLQSSIQ